ncbi:Mitochondrial magnesium exporter 1 [Podosphaera aphanis]|nr:Mitochondrial magnesium exporter 1 [Podosphaera aphanis]
MLLASLVANLLPSGLLTSPQPISNSFDIVKNEKNYTPVIEPEKGETMAHQEERRPPYLLSMIAGGLGGTTGDLLMHSLDTVKTRQQGDPHIPPKYKSMSSSYSTIFKQEGLRQGLYGGWLPALLGSFPGTVIFFGTYEYCKRNMIDCGISRQVSYLTSGFIADFAASFIYVPSEVLKTRLQLQGRYNNPYFNSGYNYKSTIHAARTIIRQEGLPALYYGYKATMYRDLPFSALQFYFYEQGQTWARRWKKSREIGVPLELATGATAGGLSGLITCPLDVVKTRTQTQINPNAETAHKFPSSLPSQKVDVNSSLKSHIRNFSTSPSSTKSSSPGLVNLETSVFTGLRSIYISEGLSGLFRGVGPRIVWTSVQSGCMLFLYQKILRQLEIITTQNDRELTIR